jgi:hypothetical protein
LKALIINSQDSEVVDWFEFENDFGIDRLLQGAVEMMDQQISADFDATIEEFKQRYSIHDLLNTQ